MTMRSAKFSYIAVSGFFFLISIYGLFQFLITGIYDSLELSGIFLIPGIGWIIWVASFRLILEPDSLTYSQLFQGTRSIGFNDILKVDRRNVVDTQLSGLNRLLIWQKNDPHNPYIAVNLKMFKASDVQHLLSVLKPYAHKK